MATVRIFRHHIRLPYFLLGLLEAAILFCSVYAGAHLRFIGASPVIDESVGLLAPKALVFAIVMVVCMGAMGLYQTKRTDGITNIVLRVATTYVMGTIALASLFYLAPPLYLGRGVLMLAVLTSLIGVALARVVFLNIVASHVLKRRVLVYGAGERALEINRLRKNKRRNGFHIVGFVHVPSEADQVDSHKVIRLDIPLLAYAREEDIDEIVVAVVERRGLPLQELLDCRLSGIDVIEPVTFFERESGKLSLESLSAGWMVYTDGFGAGSIRGFTQRLFDICVSAGILTLGLPLIALTALAIRLESGRGEPILYRQLRTGKHGKAIELLKFRSMRTDAEANGEARWAAVDDDRVTRVGAWIRKYRIDELPQLVNILRGDMSLVGPRPERPEFVEALSKQIPFYSERHRVKPGLAGWAQMNYPYGACEEDALQKLQYDLYYVKNHSLFLDFLILVQTAEIVLFGKGAR